MWRDGSARRWPSPRCDPNSETLWVGSGSAESRTRTFPIGVWEDVLLSVRIRVRLEVRAREAAGLEATLRGNGGEFPVLRFTQSEDRFRERSAVGDLRADRNKADEGEELVRADRGPAVGAGEFEEPSLEGRLRVRQGIGIAEASQAPFREVREKVPGIHRGVPARVEVEIQEIQPAAVHDHVVLVEVPVDPARLGFRNRRAEPGPQRERKSNRL